MLRFKGFIRDNEGYRKIERCHNCGIPIKNPDRKTKFVNATQNIHYIFCNSKCKAKWIERMARL